jgi:hypothetical protein
MARNNRFAGRGRFLLCAVVLVAPVVVRLSCGRNWCSALALDWGRPFCARFCSGVKVHLGLWMERTWNARTVCAPAKARSRRILPICSEPYVCGILRRLDGPLGGVGACKPVGYVDCVRGCGRGGPLRTALRRTHTAKNVRCRV